MNRVPIAALLLVAAWSACAQTPSTGSGQAFPAKPVKIVSPYPAGLTPDIAARALANSESVLASDDGGDAVTAIGRVRCFSSGTQTSAQTSNITSAERVALSPGFAS